MASVINFLAMLVLPPLFMPLLALVLSVIYSFGNGSRRPLIHMIFFFCSYCYIYFAGGFDFRLVSGQDFERVTWVMLLGVILAFAAWVIVNYGSITLFNYLIRKPDPFFQLRNLSRDIPYQAIVMPLGLINSMMLVSYDYLLVVLWSLVLVSTGAVTNRLAQLQAQLLFQNEQLTRKKEELEEISRREQSVGKIIAQSAGRLCSIALDQSNTISKQFEQLHEISSILTELSQSAQQVADTASKVLYSAQQSLEEAQSG